VLGSLLRVFGGRFTLPLRTGGHDRLTDITAVHCPIGLVGDGAVVGIQGRIRSPFEFQAGIFHFLAFGVVFCVVGNRFDLGIWRHTLLCAPCKQQYRRDRNKASAAAMGEGTVFILSS
jgi:hypothetical protein